MNKSHRCVDKYYGIASFGFQQIGAEKTKAITIIPFK